ncbi:T9SS type A sorting domain-containing protein [Flavobacterium sp. N502540]|uniref:T9SS type A sorting domain-containing protein n=1 Tax=Flavobacterium sp. N502540 TaxID=2986838 RepID=UPI002224E1E5|nr:T9SS type A sorting domain-containing protein [Flavobacterium sp. N502540]
MKKTLLFFILLFSNYFYAQVSDMEHCYGDTRFNLTLNQSALLVNLNPVKTTLSYHLSAQDAATNTNAIAQPTSFNSTAPSTTIYARIDNKGTVTTNYFNLKIYDQINFIPLTTPVSCKGQNNGILTVAPSGGKTPYAYSLDGGPFTVYIGNPIGTFRNLSAGTHTIAVKDAIGCQSMLQTFQITEPSALTVKLFTENQTVVVSASGGTSPYQYSSDGINYQTSYVFSNMPVGSYTFRVKDAQGCVASESVNVYYPLAVGTQILKPIDCIEKARVSVFAAGGSAPYVYAVNKGPYQPINVFSNLAAGDYVFEVKDVQNVVRYANVTIAELVPLSITTTKTDATTNDDNDGTITVTANGALKPYTYTLTDNANNPIRTQQASNVFQGLKSGTYGVLVNDATNCIASQTNISILKKTAALTAIANVLPITCFSATGTITVVATGGKAPYKYSVDNGNTFVTSNTFSGLTAGVYTVKVRDTENAEVQLIVEISPGSNPSVSVTTFSNVYCKGDNTGSVTVTAAGGKAPYRYAIDGVTFRPAPTFTNLRTGAYNITVQDANDCTALTSIYLSEPTEELSATAFAINDQGIIVNAKGGTAPYLYSLQNNLGVVIAGPKDNGVFTKLPLGVYTAQVTDAYGCGYMRGGVTVIPSPPLAATAEVIPATCGTLGKITVTATGGIQPYSYSINNGTAVSSNVFPNLAPGNYTITVKDSENTTKTFVVAITVKQIALNVTLMTAVSCNGANNGSIRTTVTDGQGPYVYSINNDVVTGTTTEQTFNNLPAGNYIIRVTDKNNCTSNINIAVPEPTILNATVVVNDKTITTNTTGGTPPYLYTLQDHYTGATIRNYQVSNVFDNLPAGMYSVQVKDSNECSILKTGNTISDSVALSVSFTVFPMDCNTSNGRIIVTATGGTAPYEYSIDNGNSYTSSNVFSNLTAGNYLIKVRDSQTTTAAITAVISPPNPLTATAFITKTIDCLSNGTIDVIVSGGNGSYQYSIDNGVTYTSNRVFTNLIAGTYSVLVKDALNCTVITNSIILEQPIPLTATVAHTPITNCSSPVSDVVINAVGGTVPYQYSLNGLPFQSSSFYTGINPGNYILEVRDANGCSFSTVFTIETPVSFVATVAINQAQNCNDFDIATITAIGGQPPYTYSFNESNTFSAANTFTLAPGTYTLKAKDSNGCIAVVIATIAPRTTPESTLIITNATTATSNDGALIVNATRGTAPYTYTLLNSNNTIIVPAQSANSFYNLAPGTYSVIVKDARGCSSIQTQLTILAPSPLLATAAIVQPDCNNPMGTITVTASGGTPFYQYSMDNGVTYNHSNTFMVSPGSYSIKVRDLNNALYTFVTTIVAPNPVHLTAVVISSVSCVSNGVIMANAIGGQAPYTYSINGSPYQASNTFANLNAGVYTITVRDTNNCTETTSLVLQAPIPVAVSATVYNKNITVTATGGTAPYQYSLDLNTFQSGNTFTVFNYGMYQVAARDAMGCIALIHITIDPPAPLIGGKNTLTVDFKSGQTLGDLVIEGQNIKWYSTKGLSTGKTSKTSETTLPLTTVLVDGVTYYATQTIDGIESTERLAVTAKVNGSLSTSDFALPDFRFYPNPVQHNLSIQNSSAIDEIELLSVSGKTILSKRINHTQSEIDLSNVAAGFYFLKVKAEGQIKTVKIVKK